MKKIVLHFFAVLFFLIVISSYSFVSAGFFKDIPGVNCGIGGSTEDNVRCCGSEKTTFHRISPIFERIPIIGNKIQAYNDKLEEVEKIQDELGGEPCLIGTPSMTDYTHRDCKCEYTPTASASASMREMCTKYLVSPTELRKCLSCVNDRGGMYSGMGCVPLNASDFIGNFLLSWGIGFAGGIALLCIIYSAFRMQTSMGNPDTVKKAQENLTACITGLILIIFSVFILRLIGVSILRIPFLE